MHRKVCTALGEKHRGERCFSSWLCLHFCVCSVQNRLLAIQVREVEWEDGAARPDLAGACTCRQGNRKVNFWKIWFSFYLVFPISWVFDVIFSFFTVSPPEFWLFALGFFSIFFPTIETVDVIVHNKMKLKQLVWNYCKVFNLRQMIDLSKLSVVSNLSLNLCTCYICCSLCSVKRLLSSTRYKRVFKHKMLKQCRIIYTFVFIYKILRHNIFSCFHTALFCKSPPDRCSYVLA